MHLCVLSICFVPGMGGVLYLQNLTLFPKPPGAEIVCCTLQREDRGSETQVPCAKSWTTQPALEDISPS